MQQHTKGNVATYTFDDIDELDEFILDLMKGGTGYFRGIEVHCEHGLGYRKWTMYAHKIISFTADIGPDDLGYTSARLVGAGILDAPQG